MRQPHRMSGQPRSELAEALTACRGAFISIGLMSGMSNILMLTGSFFMLEVYDRVLPSRSVPTLVGLSLLAGGLYIALGLLDLIRARILVRIGSRLDEYLSGRVYETIVRLPLKTGNRSDGLQPMRDLDSIRSFLSGLGPTALFDLPWMPIYLIICFMFHPYIGLAALFGAIVLGIITMLTETMTRDPTRTATQYATARATLAEASRRNAEVITAMGMTGRIAALWSQANTKYLASQLQASDVAGGFGSMSKVLRMILQSGVLAVGAYLVIYQQATGGIIIAGSILSARALAPVDLAIANWRGFVGARQSWKRLTDLLKLLPSLPPPMPLQPPSKSLSVETASVVPPGRDRLVVHDVSLALQAGNGLGVIGPSGSGKSSLARMLVGVWRPVRGRVRLDGAALDQWSPEALGQHIGYVPQDVELFAGTVAQNIGRFADPIDSQAVIAAAQAASVHDLIVSLPEGYETQVGESGTALSAGQAQRVALARALYGDPFLVVLDEPNSNLDAEGDEALSRAILGVRTRGGIVVVVAHRPSAIAHVDLLLMMNQGRGQAFGPKDEVLARVLQRDTTPQRALKVVPEAGGAKP
jgi:PrtD family type I secretion system ABC transporter